MRVIVTGSQWWAQKTAIWDTLAEWYGKHNHLIVVHGAYARRGSTEIVGADRWADQWATKAMAVGLNVQCERFPPQWDVFGKAAEALRSIAMVEAGVWCDTCGVDGVVLAWPLGTSRDTRRCMDLAANAGIPVENYGDRLIRGLSN